MKIITYSDLHLEFGSGWCLPRDVDGDMMILSGDIITFKNYEPLSCFLKDWNKPVLYVTGNHEYYTGRSMGREDESFRRWLAENHLNVNFLLDDSISIDGVHFFGGTMWTDFADANPVAMQTARQSMNDFRLIKKADGLSFAPQDTINLHNNFVKSLGNWFESGLAGPHVVISHHAPVINPNTQFKNSPLMPAFNSLDMAEMIQRYQPALWVYGHTHECDDQIIGKTRIISNQLGYPNGQGFECVGFDPHGKPVDVYKA